MLLFMLGLVVGALVTLRLVARWRASPRGREQQAVVRAEARLQALEAASLRELADVGQLVPRHPLGPVISTGPAEVSAGALTGRCLDVRWRRMRVPGSTCSGLLAEPIASRQTDGAHQNPGPRGSS